MSDLGTFVDRYTMRFERFYPHPVERVWEALTSAEALDAWMMPINHVDARAGGPFSFSFGGPDDAQPEIDPESTDFRTSFHGKIGDFRENEVVDYLFDNGSGMRFVLEAVQGGTKLAFIHSFTPADAFEAFPDDPGGDLPGGPDTPWRPGFQAGFHICLDNLATWLETGHPTAAETMEGIRRGEQGDHDERWLELCVVYRNHTKEMIPS
jgi:uncharacterized protein YndB with AHSA1/START domain